jgi:hypothetical protein
MRPKPKPKKEHLIPLRNQPAEIILSDDYRFRISTSAETFKEIMLEWFRQPLGVYEEYHLLAELVDIEIDKGLQQPIDLLRFFEKNNFRMASRISFLIADLLERGECNVFYKEKEQILTDVKLVRFTNNHNNAPFPAYIGRMFTVPGENRRVEVLYVQDRSS